MSPADPRTHDLRTRWLWVLFAVSVVLVWFFVELADEVVEADDLALETRILLLLREPGAPRDPVGPPWMENAARDLTALGGHAVLLVLTAAVLGYMLLGGLFRIAVAYLVAVGGAALLTVVLKAAFARPRPTAVAVLVDVSTASFPSGHSLLSAVVYPTLGALVSRIVPGRRLRVYVLSLTLLVTVLVGVSRVYLGVHYPSDVAAGWALGLAWAILCFVGLEALARRGVVEPDAR